MRGEDLLPKTIILGHHSCLELDHPKWKYTFIQSLINGFEKKIKKLEENGGTSTSKNRFFLKNSLVFLDRRKKYLFKNKNLWRNTRFLCVNKTEIFFLNRFNSFWVILVTVFESFSNSLHLNLFFYSIDTESLFLGQGYTGDFTAPVVLKIHYFKCAQTHYTWYWCRTHLK